jgi:hypothetical protein
LRYGFASTTGFPIGYNSELAQRRLESSLHDGRQESGKGRPVDSLIDTLFRVDGMAMKNMDKPA